MWFTVHTVTTVNIIVVASMCELLDNDVFIAYFYTMSGVIPDYESNDSEYC